MSTTKKYIPLVIGVSIALGTIIGAKLNFQDSGEQIFATNSKKDKLNRLIDYIDYEYVDSVNTDSIVDVTVNGILENLDPHSVYIPVDSYEDAANDMRGKFVGIGVNFYVYKDSIAVISPIVGGPAYEAGIRGGDRIITANGVNLFGAEMSRDSIVSLLKGTANSKVTLGVYKKDLNKIVEVKVRRRDVPLVSVDAAYMLDANIGYIKINRFSETTASEFKKALNTLIDRDMQTLVLDLRGNPGGYISAAQKVVDEFLEDDKLILITKSKKGDKERTLATRKGEFEKGMVYVLIDENSASASEIVAGALQDNDHGLIVGRRSFGKGLVQREMSLGDGSAVRLTIARYYTPTGRSIQRSYENGYDTYYNEYQNRYSNGELISSDSIKVSDSLKYITPGGRIVYGGGGIIPDVFVGKDTSIESETLEYVMASGYMNYFVFEHLEDNRSLYKDMSFNDFYANYQVPDSLADSFISYARLRQAEIDLSSYSQSLKRYIKSALAQQLFSATAAEQIKNEQDPMIIKIMDLERARLQPIDE